MAVWLLCIAPIAVLPGLYDRWGWPTLLCTAIAGVLAIWILPRGRMPAWFAVLLGALGVVLALAASTGPAPLAQLFGRAPRYEGLVTLPVLVVAGWAGARLLGPRAPAAIQRHAVNALATASVLLAFVGVLEAFGLRPFESDLARPGSLAGNATDQGILGAVFVALLGSVALGAWRRDRRLPSWALTGAAAGVVSAATSASRAGLVALGIVAVGLAGRFVLTSTRRARDAAVAAGGILAVLAVVLAVPLTRDRVLGLTGLAQQTVADRLFMWDDALRLILSRPWLGVGPSGYSDSITVFFGDEWFGRAGVGAILDSPHNVVVQAAASAGILGLLLAVLIVGGAAAAGVRHGRGARGTRGDLLFGGLIAVGGAGAALLTHVSSPVTMVPLAMLVGVLVAVPPRAQRSRAWRRVATAIGVVWLAFLVMSTVADAVLLDARRAVVQGDLDRSLASFATAQALRPWDPDVALVAAESLGAAVEDGLAGAADPAADWAAHAVDALPDSSRANYAAGMIAVGRGELGEASRLLARASRLSPADPRIQHELGVARLMGGDPLGAREPLQRAVALAPSSRGSWLALRDVCRMLADEACVERAEAGVRGAGGG